MIKELFEQFDSMSKTNQILTAFPIIFVAMLCFAGLISNRYNQNHPNWRVEQAAKDAAEHKAWENKFNADFAKDLVQGKDGYWTVRPCSGCARGDETAEQWSHRIAQEKRDLRDLRNE